MATHPSTPSPAINTHTHKHTHHTWGCHVNFLQFASWASGNRLHLWMALNIFHLLSIHRWFPASSRRAAFGFPPGLQPRATPGDSEAQTCITDSRHLHGILLLGYLSILQTWGNIKPNPGNTVAPPRLSTLSWAFMESENSEREGNFEILGSTHLHAADHLREVKDLVQGHGTTSQRNRTYEPGVLMLSGRQDRIQLLNQLIINTQDPPGACHSEQQSPRTQSLPRKRAAWRAPVGDAPHASVSLHLAATCCVIFTPLVSV